MSSISRFQIHGLRVQFYELIVQINELRVKILKLRLQNHEFKNHLKNENSSK